CDSQGSVQKLRIRCQELDGNTVSGEHPQRQHRLEARETPACNEDLDCGPGTHTGIIAACVLHVQSACLSTRYRRLAASLARLAGAIIRAWRRSTSPRRVRAHSSILP